MRLRSNAGCAGAGDAAGAELVMFVKSGGVGMGFSEHG
jgi:urocanate hydratase